MIREVPLRVPNFFQPKYFTNNCSKMKTMNDTPLPRPRMKKAKICNIILQFKLQHLGNEYTYENRNIAYQELSILLPRQNS